MIHNCEFTKEKFEDVATGKCSALVLIPSTEILVGDLVAVNEIGDEEAHLFIDEVPLRTENISPPTGRCCLLDVTYVQHLSGTGHTVASVQPCDVVTYTKRGDHIFGDYREGANDE